MKSVTGKTTTDILILSLAILNNLRSISVTKNLEFTGDEPSLLFSWSVHPAAGL